MGAVTVPLVRDAAGTWNSGTRYLLPAGSAPTRLSIRWVRNGEQAVYGYTYPQALTPGTPYRFEGAFVDDAAGGTVGDVSVAAWNAPIVQSFRFGKGGESPNITPTTARRRWTNRRRHVVDHLGGARVERPCRRARAGTSWVTKPTSC